MTRTKELQHSLDWLKRVAGTSDEDLARYDDKAWEQWRFAMRADRNGLCPAVPHWMQTLMPVWAVDFSWPWPQVAQLFQTEHDWFSLAEHMPDITLEIEEAGTGAHSPSLEGVRAAYAYARALNLRAYLNIIVEPRAPYDGTSVALQLEAFYVSGEWTKLELHRQYLESLMGGSASEDPTAAWSKAPHNHEAATPSPVLAWEWMYV